MNTASLLAAKPTHRVWISKRLTGEEFPFYCVARDDEHALGIASSEYPDDEASEVERIE